MLTLTRILVGLAMVALALAEAAFVVPGIECDGPVGLLLAALLYQGLSVGIGMLLPLAVGGLLGPFGLVGGLLLGTLILWLVGQIVPGYRVEGFGTPSSGRSWSSWPGSRRAPSSCSSPGARSTRPPEIRTILTAGGVAAALG